jgi:hypothetical protein
MNRSLLALTLFVAAVLVPVTATGDGPSSSAVRGVGP